MPDYRRLYARGGTYFFTVALRNRKAKLLTDRIDALRAAWRWTARRRPFRTGGGCSRSISRVRSIPPTIPRRAAAPANAASGNGGSGSI